MQICWAWIQVMTSEVLHCVGVNQSLSLKEPQIQRSWVLFCYFFFLSRLHFIPVLAVLLLCCISEGVYIYICNCYNVSVIKLICAFMQISNKHLIFLYLLVWKTMGWMYISFYLSVCHHWEEEEEDEI